MGEDGTYLLADRREIVWLVKQIWFYSLQYYRLVGDRRRRDNHHLVDHGHSPFVTGMAFPEFSRGRRNWRRRGGLAILYHFGSEFAEGWIVFGVTAAEYQYHILYHFLHPLAVAQANGMKLLSAKQIDSLRRWVQFSVRAVKPDGWLPAIGDSDWRAAGGAFVQGQLGGAGDG